MRLEEIFRKSRKTEPKAIVICRKLILLVIIALLIGYTAYLIINICNDIPILKTESRTDSVLRLPTVKFGFDYRYTVDCTLASYNSSNAPDCSAYITQPTFNQTTQSYKGSFDPPPNLMVEGQDHPNGILGAALMFTVTDRGFNYNDFKYTDDSYTQLLRKVEKSDPEFFNSLSVGSVHSLYYKQAYTVSYTQSERHIMKKNLLSAFGIPTGTLRVPYISAELEGGPLPDSIIGYGFAIFKPQTFVVKVEVEQRSNTVLGAFGLLGGIWSIAAGLYVFLLGKETIRPWGCVQSYCCCFIRPTRSKLYKSFPVIPFQSSKESSESESSFQSEDTTELQKRLEALELFIQEFMVDTGYLDGLDKGECPGRVSAWLSRFELKKNRLNKASGSGNGYAKSRTSTQRMSETPTQTHSLPIPPSSIAEVYSESSRPDSYYSSQPDTYASGLPVRQDQSQPVQEGYADDNDIRSSQLLHTAPQIYTNQER
ncbi:8343_t:CDS:2 [Paraglomus occultum]|uniref:8343_t:CDS:1 n=1 Tax=Paraglomus occultum TaxID=144539 RepID=A0A9N8ZGQ4_9GLOM|nr:8343_t:CDS:2 [Paraglomus occultum]